jgi:hypothetical protein
MKTARIIGIAAVLMVVISTAAFGFFPWFFGPTELIIEDDLAVVWMNMNNSFAAGWENWETDPPYWDGILLQLGRFPAVSTLNFVVTIEGSSSLVTFTEASFDRWINIVPLNFWGQPLDPRPDHQDMPMARRHACYLAPNLAGCPSERTDCSRIESVARPDEETCLRMKSLHGSFKPTRVMTYWTHPGGYVLTVSRPDLTVKKFRYVFTMPGRFAVYVDGVKQELGWIKSIRIAREPGAPLNDDNEDPGWPTP